MAKRDKTEPGTVAWVDLQTRDLPKARKFYSDLLGWTFVGGDDPKMGFYAMAQRSGRNVAGVGMLPENAPYPPSWTVYFGIDDADATAKKVIEAGGKVMMAPMDVMEEGRMAVFVDPSGAVFGIWQSKRHKGVQLVDEPGALTWNEVYTRDVVKARDFYARVFGLEPKRMDAPDMEYWTLHKGEKTIFGLMQMNKEFPKEVPPHWNTYFAVDDADVTAKKVTALGGKLASPPWDTPYGRMASIIDPQGAQFCIVKLPPRG